MKTFALNFILLATLAVQGCQTAQPAKHPVPQKNGPTIGLSVEKNGATLADHGRTLENDPIMQGINP